MGWAHDVAEGVVVLAAVVGIAHDESDGRSCCASFVEARQDFYVIGFVAACREWALARSASAEFALHLVKVDGESWGHAVNDASHGWSMAFAEGCQAKECAEGVHGVVG